MPGSTQSVVPQEGPIPEGLYWLTCNCSLNNHLLFVSNRGRKWSQKSSVEKICVCAEEPDLGNILCSVSLKLLNGFLVVCRLHSVFAPNLDSYMDWFVFYFWLGMRNIESSVGATLLSRCHSIFSAKKFLCKICSNCRVYLRKEIKSGYDEPTLHFQNDAKNFFFHTCVKVILSVSILAELRGFQILQCLVLYLVSWRIWLPFIWNKSIYLVLPFHVFH